MYVPNCAPIHSLTCGVWPKSAGFILWGPSMFAQNPMGINLKVLEITYACINFRGSLPDFITAPQNAPNLLAGIQKAPTVGFWFPIIKSGGVPQGEYKRRSCSEMQYRVNFVYVPLLFPSWGISQFKANNKRKGCSQRRSHLARVFWKVITSGALECNIIQNIHPPHAVLRGEQIRLKALAPPLRGHTHTHWET